MFRRSVFIDERLFRQTHSRTHSSILLAEIRTIQKPGEMLSLALGDIGSTKRGAAGNNAVISTVAI